MPALSWGRPRQPRPDREQGDVVGRGSAADGFQCAGARVLQGQARLGHGTAQAVHPVTPNQSPPTPWSLSAGRWRDATSSSAPALARCGSILRRSISRWPNAHGGGPMSSAGAARAASSSARIRSASCDGTGSPVRRNTAMPSRCGGSGAARSSASGRRSGGSWVPLPGPGRPRRRERCRGRAPCRTCPCSGRGRSGVRAAAGRSSRRPSKGTPGRPRGSTPDRRARVPESAGPAARCGTPAPRARTDRSRSTAVQSANYDVARSAGSWLACIASRVLPKRDPARPRTAMRSCARRLSVASTLMTHPPSA